MNNPVSKSKIFIVDDNPENIHILLHLKDEYELFYSLSGEEALDTICSGNRPDLILLDIMMPGMDGYEVCQRLKADAQTKDIPIIFITAMNRDEDEAKGLALGAVDYISKPFSLAIVRARISATLRLKEEMERRIMLTHELQDINDNLEKRVNEKVAELKAAHRNLEESEFRYRSIFENAVDGIFQTTTEGRILNASPSMAQLLGYDSPEELISSVTDLSKQCYVNQDDRKLFLHILNQDNIVKGFETRMKKRDGTIIWLSVSSRLVCDSQGQKLYIEGFCSDITGQKNAEKALQESEKRLRQAQKMEAMGTLAGGIAHDFNNILFAMSGYSELILNRLSPESREWYYMKKILKASHRAKELISQILNFSRQTEKERQPICIKFVVKEVLKLMGSAFPPTIEIRNKVQSDSLISADPVEIHQVLMNLCTNAFHAMQDKGGILSVSLRDTDIPKDIGLQSSESVRLEVSDTGCGMSREISARIFEPYFTTKNKEEGTGLGLATVYGIVKDLGGQISMESEIGKGSRFIIDFPTVDHIPKIEKKDLCESPVLTGQERILLVDDEKVICEMCCNILEELGYHVTAYTSCEDALVAFRAAPENFDIILSDLVMPNLNGLELAGQFMALRPDIPVIIITGFCRPDEIEKARAMGIRDFIMKPVIRSDVARAIRKALSPSPTIVQKNS